jgi:hypothetical protein
MCIKIFIQFWLVMLLLVTGSAVQADVFKWIDASGQTHYGDKPPTETPGVEAIDTFECGTQACIEEQERRWQEAMEVNQRTQDWLERRAAERVRTQDQRNLTTVYVHTYQPPQWPLVHYPGTVSRTRVLPHRPHPAPPSRRGRVNRPLGKTRMTSHRYVARPRIGTPGSAVHR